MDKPKKPEVMNKPEVTEVKFVFSQDEDTGGRIDELGQSIAIRLQDAGGGPYYVIETDRWAIDKPSDLTALLTKVSKVMKTMNE